MFRSLRLRILLDLAFASLVPMGIAMLLASLESRKELQKAGEQNVRLLARVTASQLDQLFHDTQRAAQIVALDAVVSEYCADPATRQRLEDKVQHVLSGVIGLHRDYSQIFLINDAGIGIASTNVRNIGQDLNFREYYRRARAGEANGSHWLVGKVTDETGVFFAAPVWQGEKVVGVVALKLHGARVRDVVNRVRVGTDGYAMLVDEDGIVLAHPNRGSELRLLAPLPLTQLATIDAVTRFGRPTLESMDLPALQAAVQSPMSGGVVRFMMKPDDAPDTEQSAWVAGLAEMREKPWKVMVVLPQKQFAEAAWNVVRRQTTIAVAVALAGIALSLIRARSIVKPLTSLTQAANQLAAGNFSARANVQSVDEVGQLATAFNKMVPQLENRMELQKSLEIAQRVQQSLLPQKTPALYRLDIASRSRYCDTTGGDYFDFAEAIDLPRDQRLIAVGDVTGHGLGAALVMCTARASLRTAAAEGGSMGQLLSRVNHCLCQSVVEDMFMTMTVMHIDPDKGELRYACAAHEPIILCDPDTRKITELNEGSLPLGALPGKRYDEHAAYGLKTGSVLFLGTDGVWEATNEQDESFTRARLIEIIRDNAHLPAAAIGNAVESALAAFLHGQSIQDDITYVIVKVREK